MKILGFDKMSLVDWPGKVAAVVFTGTCNMNCFYCHNRAALRANEKVSHHAKMTDASGKQVEIGTRKMDEHPSTPEWTNQRVLTYLKKRAKVMDGVVVSGGEPTLQKDLIYFLGELRKLGFQIKLDTNGSRPRVLEEVIALGLVDYVAMDIKAPYAKYEAMTDSRIKGHLVNESIEVLRDSGTPHEFRTTCVPQLTVEDMKDIAEWIKGADHWYLQQYRQLDPNLRDPSDIRQHQRQHPVEWFQQVAEAVADKVKDFQTRGVEGYEFAVLGLG